jgi:heme/copper-type cytochrome/quinol oxidase subunit 4
MNNKLLLKARLTTFFASVILCMYAFIMGAQCTLDDPMKQNYLVLIAFAEVLMLFSIASLLLGRKD